MKSEVNKKATSSQNGLRSNYLAEMPVLSDVKDCYKSDGKISLDGQWSCAEYNCTVINGQPKLCTPKETNDDNDKAKHIGNAYDFGLCKGVESDDPAYLNK